jgi:hypothetical protein
MPRGDGTGPLGRGPIGRGRGGCMGFSRGFGFGRGMGRGFGIAGNAVTSPGEMEEQATHLEAAAAILRNLAKQNRPVE